MSSARATAASVHQTSCTTTVSVNRPAKAPSTLSISENRLQQIIAKHEPLFEQFGENIKCGSQSLLPPKLLDQF
jgi:hypothetical protein